MAQFLEPNEKNLEIGGTVCVITPYPSDTTYEEILEKYSHIGVIEELKHTPGGTLQVAVKGLEAVTGSRWTYPMYCDKVVPLRYQREEAKPIVPESAAKAVPVCPQPITATVFEVRAARARYNVKWFFGEVTQISPDKFIVDNFDNSNVYEVVVREINRNIFEIACGCDDFYHKSRVCKHAHEVFEQCKPRALETDSQQIERMKNAA